MAKNYYGDIQMCSRCGNEMDQIRRTKKPVCFNCQRIHGLELSRIYQHERKLDQKKHERFQTRNM